MSSNRQLSPGGRRIANPARASDSLADPQYRYERHNSYQTSPRSSGGVIPLSTQTFVNTPGYNSTNTRPEPRFDSYSGRPTDSYSGRPTDSYSGRARRNSQVDQHRGSTSNAPTLSSRNRPTVIQDDFARPTSPQKPSRDRDFYVTPGAPNEPRKAEHKKVYSVNEGSANLVADVNVPAGGGRHHRRRESDTGERGGYRGSYPEKDRGRRGYHMNGPAKPQEKSIEDDDAYSYTTPAGMYRDTEPRWREREVRPRRGSVDRGGASRERAGSMADSMDPRKSNKEIGPPPSTRGWDKVNEMGRARSMRERSRDVPQSPTRAGVPQSPSRAPRAPMSPTRGRYPEAVPLGDPRDPYYVPPRTNSEDRRNTLPVSSNRPADRYEQYEYDDRREPRHHRRRHSVTKGDRPDHSIERRGFGIRGDSQDRYARGSDESFERQHKYRDSGYAITEPHRRETAPEVNYQEERRLEQEKNDRLMAERRKKEEQERMYEREAREKEQRHRDDDRGYSRDYEHERDQRREPRERERDYDPDRERERERERMMQAPPEHERHHHRHESNRDREYGSREEPARGSGESLAQPGLSTAAGAGLAGAAAAYGLKQSHNHQDERDKEREREYDRRQEKPREVDRDRLSPRPPEPRPQEAHSDEGLPYQREPERVRPEEGRGLGFAFENPPEPPRSAPPMRDYPEPPPVNRERAVDDREIERQHEDRAPSFAAPPAMDPDEDYRRRMEQVQRELGRAPEERSFDSDPDRERRRREREQRQRDRDVRNGDASTVGTASTFDTAPSSRAPVSFEEGSVDGTNSTTTSRPGLRRRPSALDEPMDNVPVQIIDNSMSDRRENRVRIVDPPTEEEERRPKGILKKPTSKFPDYPNAIREGVAPLKDASKSGIPPGARWTKIDRKLVNPQALEEAKERFEERLDCVIVLRVLTKEDIQKLADRTREIRDERYEEEREDRKTTRHRHRNHDRRERDEYELDDSEDEFKPRAPKMLEAPSSTTGASTTESADFIRDNRDRRRERDGDRESQYMSGGLGRRDEYSDR